MPSSTSSSDSAPGPTRRDTAAGRVPSGGTLRVLVLALALGLVATVALEAFWRARGFVPTAVDDLPLWSVQRARVGSNGSREFVLTGMSRIATAFSAERFRERLPGWHSIQLAVKGHSGLAAFRDVATDPAFRGILLLSVTARSIAGFDLGQAEHVAHYRRLSSPERRFHRRMEGRLEEKLALLQPRLSLPTWLPRLLAEGASGFPTPGQMVMRRDRSSFLRFQDRDLEGAEKQRFLRAKRWVHSRFDIPSGEAWLARAMELEPYVEQVRARGGDVVFARLVGAPEVNRVVESYFPRAKFWDRWAAETRAHTLHFGDLPGLSGVRYPDLEHTDREGAIVLTDALLDALQRKGLFTEAAGSPRPPP